MEELRLHPVGHIRRKGERVFVEILPAYRPALKGIEEYEYLHLLWWFDQSQDPHSRERLLVKTPHANAPERLGVFATRTPHRPNPIALDVVKVYWVNHGKGLLRIDASDAWDGTPVLDIKPYVPGCDRVEGAGTPAWHQGWAQSRAEKTE